MAGLLPGLLPVLSSVPIVGPLLDDDPTPTRQADDDDVRPTPPTTTREAGGAERTTTSVVQQTSITRLTPLVPGAVEQTTAPTLAPTQSNIQTTLSIPTTASITQTSISAPESTITTQDSGGGQSSSMVPAIGITAGVGALFLIVGVILWTRYRRSKWPFARRRFAMLDEPELEKNVDAKWDPSQTPGMSRISRFVSSSRY